MIRMLVSVRTVEEALQAASFGVDYLDLKEPAAGALGGLDTAQIRDIVTTVRPRHPRLMISATIGDLPATGLTTIEHAIREVADAGVDLVKVGVPGQGGEAADALLGRLALCGRPIVPVLIADDGIDDALFATACALPFPALMIDTQAKLGGSLIECMGHARLARLVATARAHGKPFGLAGALQLRDLPALRELRPAFAGFRSAVCEGSRAGNLVAARLKAVREGLGVERIAACEAIVE
jgi:uncharacterized protein (UPF0264 family)